LLNKTAKTAANNKVLIRYDWLYLVRVNMQLTMAERRKKALAAMNATMSRVNGIFNKDLAVRLVLIANNDAIVYLDAATDPYSAATTGAAGAWSQEAQTTLTDVIGEGYWRCFGIGWCVHLLFIPLGKGSAYTSCRWGSTRRYF
jgi:hypothetical protein